MGTGALRRVEREIVWRRVGVTDARCGTHQTLGEVLQLTAVFVEDHDESLALTHSDGDRLLEALTVFAGHLQFVDNHLDVVVLITVDLHTADNLKHLTIDAYVEITLAAHGLKEFAVVTLTTAYQRCQYKNATPFVVV